MKDRIVTILKTENLTAMRLAEILGVQRSGISHILSGRNKPSLDFVQAIIQNFAHINPEWLIMGIGDYSRSGNKEVSQKKMDFAHSENSVKEIVTAKKAIRIVTFYSDSTFEEFFPNT